MLGKLAFLLFAAPLAALSALAAETGPPRIAVADLAYEEKVAQHFQVVSYQDRQRWNDSSRAAAAGDSASSHERSAGRRDSDFFAASGELVRIERGELRKFTADIKGEMLKRGAYRLVQAKPYTAKDNEKLYDVIERIRQGQFPNADYVLFSSIAAIEPRREVNPVPGANAASATLSLELLVDCSLIDTRSYEIKAAFSALGEGQDMRLLTALGQQAQLSAGKVMREVSQSLGADVARQIEAQFDPGAGRRRGSGPLPAGAAAKPEKLIEYR